MQILKEGFSTKAWCITRSGNLIPVTVHPFGALDEYATEDAAWLAAVDSNYDYKTLIRYISNQICYEFDVNELWEQSEITDIIKETLQDIESLKGMPNTAKVIYDVCKYQAAIKDDVYDMTLEDTKKRSNEIKKYLNDNYLRARYGSEYQNNVDRVGSIYFRTSSTDGYNWYNIIVHALDSITRSYKINDVTIERDVSSTGDKTIYVNHMPLSEFLLRKPIVIESVGKCTVF